jgi:hypothetical protein
VVEEVEAEGFGEGVEADVGFGGGQGPWGVLNVTPVDAAVRGHGVVAVAFGQELGERAWR